MPGIGRQLPGGRGHAELGQAHRSQEQARASGERPWSAGEQAAATASSGTGQCGEADDNVGTS